MYGWMDNGVINDWVIVVWASKGINEWMDKWQIGLQLGVDLNGV